MNYKIDDQSSKSFKDDKSLEGSSTNWNAIWGNADTHQFSRECLFTRRNTKTIYEFWQRVYAEDLLNLIQTKKYNDFLELGSGRGTTSMYLNNAGYDSLILVDLSENAQHLAIKNFTAFHLKFKDFILADVRKTPLQNNSFDCIYNIGLLEHFQEPGDVLTEAYRLLRPGGLLFMPIFPDLISPHCYLVRMLFNPFSYFKKIVSRKRDPDGDMIRTKLSKEEYSRICANIGFTKVECLYYNPFPKIIRDGWYENTIVLRAYKLVHFFRNLRNKKLQFQTNSFFGTAYLLVAYK